MTEQPSKLINKKLANEIRDLIKSLSDKLNQAESRGISVSFSVSKGPDGKFVPTSSIQKIENL